MKPITRALQGTASDQPAVGDPGEAEADPFGVGFADVVAGNAADDVDETRTIGVTIELDTIAFRADAGVLECRSRAV